MNYFSIVTTSRSVIYLIVSSINSLRISNRLPCLPSGDDSVYFQSGQFEADDEHAEGEVAQHPIRGFPRLQSVCGQPQQTQAYSGHFATQSGEIGRIPDQVPHGSIRGRAVQRRKGLPYKTNQRAPTSRELAASVAKSIFYQNPSSLLPNLFSLQSPNHHLLASFLIRTPPSFFPLHMLDFVCLEKKRKIIHGRAVY